MASILIVDDQPINREFLVTLLGYKGHHLMEAADGAEALERAGADPPDLIITDILMPTMDGYEFVRRVRDKPNLAQIPIIFYTAHYRKHEAEALALACGVEHILMKPSEPETVLHTVESVLNLPTPPLSSPPSELFDQEHVRLLTNKLSQKVEELREVNNQLNRLIDLNLNLALERDSQRLLENLGQAAQGLVGAKCAVVSLQEANEPGLRHLFSSGLDRATADGLGSQVAQSDLLDGLLAVRQPQRRYNPSGKPTALGFPDTYPPIHALLIAPILSPSRIYGWLYLIDKTGAAEFNAEEERLIGILAAQTGRIYENNQLYAELEYRLRQLEQEMAERRQAEEALRRSEERFSKAFQSSPDMLVISRLADGYILEVNTSWETVAGYSREEVIGRTSVELNLFINPLDRQQIMNQLREQGSMRDFELDIRGKSGEVRQTSLSAEMIMLNNEPCLLTIVRDITERKQADERIRYLARLIENVSDAIISTDMEFNVLTWNHAAEGIYGWLATEVSGKPLNNLLHTKFLNGNRESALAELFERDNWQGEVIQRRKDGATIHILASISMLKDSAGQPGGMVAVNRDITERKRMEERLREKREQLRHLGTRMQNVAETEKRQLSRELHDRVGQSTTILALDLSILESLLPAEAIEAREWLDQSLTEVKQITAAIRGVMHELRPPELDDYGLTAALQWYAQQFEQRSGLPVVARVVELTPRLLQDTETALFRITQEAMTNILKHAHASQITLTLESLAQGVRLSIIDNGRGFVPHEAEAPRPSVKEGGWGLLTMQERALAIGGELIVISAQGQGTQIIVDVKR